MCVVSMIIDHYGEKWGKKQPGDYLPTINPWPSGVSPSQIMPVTSIPTKEEIDEFYDLLRKAREYDKKNNEPDCEMEEKKQKLLKLAEELGITIRFDV